MKKKLKHVLRRKKEALKQALPTPEPTVNETPPRITNETVAVHREEVLGKARKYIYPLQHSKHRIVLVSVALLIAGVVAFFTYCTLALYRFQNTSTFLYRVTEVMPFPIARAGGRFISYENYLFELRHYTHYYENQAKLDFKTEAGKAQLAAYRKQALDKVINDAYVKEMAEKYKVSVTDQEVTNQLAVVRAQNRLGSSDKVFADVLKEYWGWTVADFKRSLRAEMLAQKVVSAQDSETHAKAEAALAQLKNGADFAAVAKATSDDQQTAGNGGDMGTVSPDSRDVPPSVLDALFKLQPGQTSGIINTGYALEIVKNIEATGDGKIHAAHIVFTFKDISTYLNPVKEQQKARVYVSLN